MQKILLGLLLIHSIMKCRFCGKRAEIVLKMHRIALCKKCYPRFFENRVLKVIEKEKMFSKGDKVCVAISGGKDSMSLLHVLKKLGFEIAALHIDLGIEGYSTNCKEVVKSYCESLEIPLIMYNLKKDKGQSINEVVKRKRRSACSICGAMKRQVTNKLARDAGYDVLATGHNMDDGLIFVFLNLLKADIHALASYKPVLDPSTLMVKKVKPLYRFTDFEIRCYAEIENISYYAGKCPFSRSASASFYREWWNILEKKKPGIKNSFYWSFINNIQPIFSEYESKTNFMGEVKRCKMCGEPTNRDICSVCAIFSK
jgi:uncharacterized protein (TIGR00269 family)